MIRSEKLLSRISALTGVLMGDFSGVFCFCSSKQQVATMFLSVPWSWW
jgi:hypothetical protein